MGEGPGDMAMGPEGDMGPGPDEMGPPPEGDMGPPPMKVDLHQMIWLDQDLMDQWDHHQKVIWDQDLRANGTSTRR